MDEYNITVDNSPDVYALTVDSSPDVFVIEYREARDGIDGINGSDVSGLSGRWESTFNTVNSLSAGWGLGGGGGGSSGSDVSGLSARWETAYTTLSTKASLSALNALSARHNNLDDTVNTLGVDLSYLNLQIENKADLLAPNVFADETTFDGDVYLNGAIYGLDKSYVGLGNVDNTSDLNKPVSTAQQTALNLKSNQTQFATLSTQTTSGLSNLSSTKANQSLVNGLSSKTDTLSANVNSLIALSSNWQSTYNTVKGLSSGWGGGGGGSDVSSLSANWENSYSLVSTLSTQWGLPQTLLGNDSTSITVSLDDGMTYNPIISYEDIVLATDVYDLLTTKAQLGIDGNSFEGVNIFETIAVAQSAIYTGDVTCVNNTFTLATVNFEDVSIYGIGASFVYSPGIAENHLQALSGVNATRFNGLSSKVDTLSSITSGLVALSSNWQSTYNTVKSLSSGWGGGGGGSDVSGLSARWETSYTTLSTKANLAGGNNLVGQQNLIGGLSAINGASALSALRVSGYTENPTDLGTVTTTATININSGTAIRARLTASTACTFTMPSVGDGKAFTLLLKQAAATGNGSATFTGVKWPGAVSPVITATAGKMDILNFVSDGANWYGSITQNFTP